MQDDQPNNGQSGAPLLPQRPVESSSGDTTSMSQAAAAQIVRSQINSLYDQQNQTQAATTPSTQTNTTYDVHPYDRTHTEHVDPQAEQWKQYHSAWQTYYQKYYEGYYTHHLKQATQAIQAHAITTATQTGSTYFGDQATPTVSPTDETISSNEALYDLRQKLLTTVAESAKKVRKSRHFVPITAALLVMLLFAFLQYNQLLIGTVMAYVSPGNIDPQNIIVDPSTTVTVGPEPLLIIPKINVDAPVSYDIGNDYTSQMAAMTKGLAWFGIPGAESHPGQIGNTVIAGHSSNDYFDTGDYKFIFAQLDKLAVGDSIYANYHSVRYTYVVTGLKVVSPTDVSSLVYPTTKPIMTLLTCTPVGTSLNRLLVIAEQVSPDPSGSSAAPTTSSSSATPTTIPGTQPTLLEKLFGAKG